MSEEQISTAARLNAERLMSGRAITEDEMRVIMAGLLLSVDRLTNAFNDMRQALWSEVKMREMIAEEVVKHCKAKQADGACSDTAQQRSATWVGRMLRSLFGAGAVSVLK